MCLFQITTLKSQVHSLRNKCVSIQSTVLEDAIKNLPSPLQQEAVKACFKRSAIKNSKNMRYSTIWVYNCLLLRIKSRSTYEHLRKVNMLPLPCIRTLNQYIRRIKGCYEFQKVIFDLLKKKASAMDISERRGKTNIYIYCYYKFKGT